MDYENIKRAVFLSRPNRFIAHCALEGETVTAHVKNTGRCRELLIPGVPVSLVHHPEDAQKARKTRYSLVAVKKGVRWINIDSQAPNQAVAEAFAESRLDLPGFGVPEFIRRESVFGDSRFDFYLGKGERRGYAEVKGVTLEENGACFFPDAPTERGVKHLRELIAAREQGLYACLIFLVQMENVAFVAPNTPTHPAFAQTLRQAAESGVVLLAYDCSVTPGSMTLRRSVPVRPDWEKPPAENQKR